MIKHDLEKRSLEKAAIELFVGCYKEAYGIEYRLVRQQERPDAIIEDENGSRLGLEITHLFYDELEAKMLLGRTAQETHGLENFEDHIKILNSLLEKKGKIGVGYSTDYLCSLLIRNASPIWTKEDFEGALSKIDVSTNRYKDIWLLTRDRFSNWNLVRLK